MGEIKSTLDLIMEKTKAIVVTEEEKRQMKLKELENSVLSMFRRYEGNAMSEEELISGLKSLMEKEREYVLKVINSSAVAMIKITNSEISGISLLKKLFPQSSQYLDKLATDIFEQIKIKQKQITQKEISTFKSQGIQGDAVIVNIDVVPEWKHFLNAQEKKLKEEISKAIDKWADENNP